ncbi:hypothetical protein TNCV_4082771 [Trichonephila clavipes]|nr:hypothetical protein TNCV_4082771 [Trichonephila clavipes]
MMLLAFPPAYLMFGTLPYDSPLPNQVKLNYPPIQQARQIAVNRTIKHHKINKQKALKVSGSRWGKLAKGGSLRADVTPGGLSLNHLEGMFQTSS